MTEYKKGDKILFYFTLENFEGKVVAVYGDYLKVRYWSFPFFMTAIIAKDKVLGVAE